jgi:hypothetical protein
MNVVVADSRLHAEAIIRWAGLNPENWVPGAYGKKLNGLYDQALLVRPLAGITEEHSDWIIGYLVPRVLREKGIKTHPSDWLPGEEEMAERDGPEAYEAESVFA